LPGTPSFQPAVRQGQIGIVPRAAGRGRNEEEPEPTPEELTALFDAHVSTILSAFRGHEPFDVIGALALVNVVIDTERDGEHASGGLIAAAEFGAVIAVSAEASAMEIESPRQRAGSQESAGDAVLSVQDRLIACVLMGGPPDAGLLAKDTAHRRFFAQLRMMRNDRFDHQEIELLEGLLTPAHIAAQCRQELGFDANEAIILWDAILLRYQASYKAAVLTDADQAGPLSRSLILTKTGLAGDTSLPDKVVGSFLDTFSVGLGEVPIPRRTDDATLIRRRPLVRDGQRFICTVPSNLLRTIRPALEDGLKRTPGWEAYQRHRGKHCEARAISILRDFLRPEFALSGLSFGQPSDTGECDALLVLDDTALILEVKSGTLRAGRNALRPESLGWTIKELIEHPASQLDTARAALLSGSPVWDSSGPLDLPFGHIKRVYGLIVTLESLTFAAPMLWRLQDEGLLSAGRSLPWLIGLYELESICQILEFPAQLLHFLDAHQRMDQLRCVEAADEIDVLMAYLDMGLRFDWLPPAERILLPADSDQLNNWVFYKRGIRTKATPRPMQYLPIATRLGTRATLRQLDRDRPRGFMSSSFHAIERALDEADAERRESAPSVPGTRSRDAIHERYR
jgi:hypothetical protein